MHEFYIVTTPTHSTHTQTQGVVGWYVARPAGGSSSSSSSSTDNLPRPTLRELAVLQSLGRHLTQQQEQQQGGGSVVCPPPVLLVVLLGLRPREATQAWSYGLYYLQEEAGAGAGAEVGVMMEGVVGGEGCVA